MMVVNWGCSSKSEHSENEKSDSADAEWKEMDEFHMVMAESFHPYRDSGNVEPAKQLAAEMVTLASMWLNSELPERVNNETVKKQLNDLKSATEVLESKVKAGDDQSIGASLTIAHDAFHHLQQAWHKKEHKD